MKICKLKLTFLAIIFLALFGWAESSEAATYYVSTTGSDSNNGTSESTLWQTINKVNTSSFSPGDSILFKKGETWREQLTVPSSGSAGNPITFGAYGTGESPIISGANSVIGVEGDWTEQGDGVWRKNIGATAPAVVIFNTTALGTSDATPDTVYEWTYANPNLDVYTAPGSNNPTAYYTSIEAGARTNAISITGKNYVTVDGFDLKGSNSQVAGVGGNTTGVRLQNSTLSYNGPEAGVIFWTAAGSGGKHYIDNNIIHDVGGDGLTIYDLYSGAGTESYIQNNEIYNTGKFGVYHKANYWIIQRNVVHDTGTVGVANWGIGVQSEASDSGTGKHNIVRYNTIYNTKGDDVDACGIELDHWTTENDVYYNLSYNNQGDGLTVYNTTAARIYNNVFFGNNQSGTGGSLAEIAIVSTSDLLDNVTLKNNIAHSTAAGGLAILVNAESAGNTLTITNNDWYRASGNWYSWAGTPGATLATWNALTGVGTDLNADPLFVSTVTPDFSLQAGSPAINAGVDVGLTTDYLGNAIVGLPDIGAYEHTSGDTTAPAAPQGLSVN